MTRVKHLSAVVAVGLSLAVAGCLDSDESVDLTGTWDMTDVTGKSVITWNLTQSGNSITGLAEGGMPISGALSDNLLTCTMTMGSHPVTFTVTVSDDGNSVSGTWVNDNNITGILNGLRRGTGEGVDMTGTWLSVDLGTSASQTMQVTQNGTLLSGTTQGALPVALQGTISGSEVAFTMQVGGSLITWTGHLSVDGNTVTGGWVNSGTTERGDWRMTRG